MGGWQFHPILIVFQIGGVLSVGVGLYSLVYLRRHGWRLLVAAVGLLAFNNAIWVYAATLKVASATLAGKLFWYKLQFFGSWVNPYVSVVIAFAYLGWDHRLDRRTLAAVAAIPAVTVPLAVVNPADLMIVSPELVDLGGVTTLEHGFTPLFSLTVLAATATATFAGLLVGYGAVRGVVPRPPAVLVSLVLLIPVAVVSLKLLDIYPPGGTGINLTPAVTGVSLTLLTVAIGEYRLFELQPVGRERAIDVMQDGYVLLDDEDTVVDANPAARELLTGSADAPLSALRTDEFPPRPAEFDGEGTTIRQIDDRIVTVVSSPITRETHAPLSDTDKLAGRVLVLHDITEKERRVRELEDQTERLGALFANTTAAVVEYVMRDGEPIIEEVNGQFESLFGYETAEVVGESVDDVIVPPDGQREARSLNDRVEAGEYLSAEVERETTDGRRTFLLRNAPIDTTAETRGYASYTDISERKAYERKLEAQNEKLELINRIVRHDINNDVSVITAYADFVLDHVDGQVEEHVQTIRRHGEHIVNLTGVLADLMRAMLDEGTELKPVSLADVIETEVEHVRDAFGEVVVRTEGDFTNTRVLADEMLPSVFRNLLRNAIQHNDEATPTVTVRIRDHEDSVTVEIADNGPGIPEERREEVFGRGEKGLASNGTGIGLYLVDTLVDSYGGSVRVSDNKPNGAVFTVELQRANTKQSGEGSTTIVE
jgi:PAS domain S-box-containing protein